MRHGGPQNELGVRGRVEIDRLIRRRESNQFSRMNCVGHRDTPTAQRDPSHGMIWGRHIPPGLTGLQPDGKGRWIEIVLWTDDADAALNALVAKGAPLLSPAHDFLDGKLRAAWIADPDGNPIQLVQRRQCSDLP